MPVIKERKATTINTNIKEHIGSKQDTKMNTMNENLTIIKRLLTQKLLLTLFLYILISQLKILINNQLY